VFTARYALGLYTQFLTLASQCIHAFCTDLRTNSDYFPMRHQLIGFITETECVYCAVRTGYFNVSLILVFKLVGDFCLFSRRASSTHLLFPFLSPGVRKFDVKLIYLSQKSKATPSISQTAAMISFTDFDK
jgi:hypothetical protein